MARKSMIGSRDEGSKKVWIAPVLPCVLYYSGVIVVHPCF